MEFLATTIQGLTLVKPRRFVDNRGYFSETYRGDLFARNIGHIDFVQDNESQSTRGVLRGLHLQTGADAQAKLVRVVEGEVFDVAVDLRPDSPSRGKWFGTVLSHENALMMFIPRGFAHGFMVLSHYARFVYKTDNYYAPEAEVTVAFDDKDIDIQWPHFDSPLILSERDREHAISLKEYFQKYTNNPE